MKLKKDYLTLKIPIFRICKGKKAQTVKDLFPVLSDPKVGRVITTAHAWDVGVIAEVNDGKATKIYAPYILAMAEMFPDYVCSEYNTKGGDCWYDTGVDMTFKEWRQLCINLKDAAGFFRYWRTVFGLEQKSVDKQKLKCYN